jgi:hypothetical protein
MGRGKVGGDDDDALKGRRDAREGSGRFNKDGSKNEGGRADAEVKGKGGREATDAREGGKEEKGGMGGRGAAVCCGVSGEVEHSQKGALTSMRGGRGREEEEEASCSGGGSRTNNDSTSLSPSVC